MEVVNVKVENMTELGGKIAYEILRNGRLAGIFRYLQTLDEKYNGPFIKAFYSLGTRIIGDNEKKLQLEIEKKEPYQFHFKVTANDDKILSGNITNKTKEDETIMENIYGACAKLMTTGNF